MIWHVPARAQGRALALRVEPASGLQRPAGRLTIPHAGGKAMAIPFKDRKARRAMQESLFPPGGDPRRQARSRWPLRGQQAARRAASIARQ